MDTGTLIILFVIFMIIYMIIPKRSKKRRKIKRPHRGHRQPSYRSGQEFPQSTSVVAQPLPRVRDPKRIDPRERDNKRALALSLEKHHQFREAAELYLEIGEIFNAAKAIAKIGPQAVPEAVNLIQQYNPNKLEMLIRNLVRFFYDTNRPEIAAEFLDAIGLHGQAEAIRATIPSNQRTTTRVQPQVYSAPHVATPPPSLETHPQIIDEGNKSITAEIPQEKEATITESTPPTQSSINIPDYSIPILLAANELEEPCTVCRGKIKAGQTYTTCPSCKHPAHSKHLLEWIKVKGTCPHCKVKLRIEMFQL